jgi:hypothetical protein
VPLVLGVRQQAALLRKFLLLLSGGKSRPFRFAKACVVNVTTWRNLTHSPFATQVAWGARTLALPLDKLIASELRFGKREDRHTLILTVEETVSEIPPPQAYEMCR